jgi:hypothetical protein
MTDRQIQELLLTHYLFAIEMVETGNDGLNAHGNS